jgi:hypothetical protein
VDGHGDALEPCEEFICHVGDDPDAGENSSRRLSGAGSNPFGCAYALLRRDAELDVRFVYLAAQPAQRLGE